MYMYDLHFSFSFAEIFHCFSFCFCPYANSYLSRLLVNCYSYTYVLYVQFESLVIAIFYL